MALGVIGRKVGMTRVFTKDGISIPVTVIEVEPNRITQIKNLTTDGYNAIQVTTGQRRANRINKPQSGHFAKTGVGTGRGLWEFRFDVEQNENYKVGYEIKADIFEQNQKVDVIGTTIGKGFTGTIRRHNFSSQRNSHGNSLSHRVPGSIGQYQTPGRVFKGKKMAGHVGAVRRTIQNLEIIRVDSERNLLLIKGAVPGAKGSDVIVRPSVKTKS
jgi:large subunit ribosomal protein L3